MFAERDALVRAGRTARFSRAQVGARAVWRRAGVQSLPTAENGQGEWIRVDEGIRPMILDLIGDIAPVVAASINRHFIPVAEMAYDEWPEGGVFALGADGRLMHVTEQSQAPPWQASALWLSPNRAIQVKTCIGNRRGVRRL